MAGFGAYQIRPVLQQFAAKLRRPAAAGGAQPSTDGVPATPFKPRGRTHYNDETTSVIGRTLISPNGMFRLGDLSSYRPVPQIEPRERLRDAAGMCVFVGGLLTFVGGAAIATYVLMSTSFGGATARAFLGTAIVCAFLLAAYAAVVVARWRDVYDRDPMRYRHVIVAVHRGESVAITPDLPYETASRIVTVLNKVKSKIPKNQGQERSHAAA